MPDRFDHIIENSDNPSQRSKLAGKIFYAMLALGVVLALYVAFFADNKTDQQARNDIALAVRETYKSCVTQNNLRRSSNKELRKPLRNFAAKQEAATNALVKLLNSIPRTPNQTERQKRNFNLFVSAFNQQAEAAKELKDVPLVPLSNCLRLLDKST